MFVVGETPRKTAYNTKRAVKAFETCQMSRSNHSSPETRVFYSRGARACKHYYYYYYYLNVFENGNPSA